MTVSISDAVVNFFLRSSRVKDKKHDKREPGLFKEEFKCTEMLFLCSKTYNAKTLPLININLAVKVSTNL